MSVSLLFILTYDSACRVYIVAVIRPYVPTLFLGALILGSAGGGMQKTILYFFLMV
jgi:hypothetical protein